MRLVPVLDFGGVETMLRVQAELVDRERWDLRVCTFWKAGEAAERIEESGVPVDVLGADPRIASPRATWALHRYLRSTAPQLVHSSVVEANYHALLATRSARVPAAVVEEVGIPDRSALGRLVFRLLYRGTDRAIGVSREVCRRLAEAGVPRDRVRHLPNCAPPEFFSAGSSLPEPPPFRFLAVGRLVPEKGFDMLLRALRGVVGQIPDVRLALAGEGPERKTLEALRNDLGLREEVRLLGHRTDVLELLRRCHAFVLPSRSEGQGIALVEAMAAGRPVLGSTAGGIPEVLEGLDWAGPIPADDVRAWTDAMLRLASLDPDRLGRLGREARERAEEAYAPHPHMAALSAIWREALEPHRA